MAAFAVNTVAATESTPAGERSTGPRPAPTATTGIALAGIAGTGHYVPPARLTNRDLESLMDTSGEWIVERTGISERRIAAPGEATASMAAQAGRAAIANSGVRTSEIDLCLVATCTADQPLPSAAAMVADALGLHAAAFDLAAACSGFVYGLVVATALVGTGMMHAGLVIGADTLSRITDFSDRSTGMLFGDGAGAAVVMAADTNLGARERAGLVSWDLGCDGSAASILEIPAGGSRLPASAETVASGQHTIRMDGREVYRRAVRAVVESATATLARAGVAPQDVDLFVPHQANARIVEAVLPRLGIPAERTLMNIDRYGNTSAASIPIALDEARLDGRLVDGDLVLMTGFGAGMTWASALLRWGSPR